MIKGKIILLTIIFSTQLCFDAFSMKNEDDKQKRGISKKEKRGGTQDPTLSYQVQGQNLLNQQQFDPTQDPSRQTVSARQQTRGTLNPNLPYQMQGQNLLNQQPRDLNQDPSRHGQNTRQQVHIATNLQSQDEEIHDMTLEEDGTIGWISQKEQEREDRRDEHISIWGNDDEFEEE